MHALRYLVTLCLALATLSSPVKRKSADDVHDLEDIDDATELFYKSIVAFPSTGGTTDGARNVEKAAHKVVDDLNRATDYLRDHPHTHQGNDVFDHLKTLTSDTQKATDKLVTEKDSLQSIPGATDDIKNDLSSLEQAFRSYSEVLLETDLDSELSDKFKEQVELIKKALKEAFEKF